MFNKTKKRIEKLEDKIALLEDSLSYTLKILSKFSVGDVVTYNFEHYNPFSGPRILKGPSVIKNIRIGSGGIYYVMEGDCSRYINERHLTLCKCPPVKAKKRT